MKTTMKVIQRVAAFAAAILLLAACAGPGGPGAGAAAQTATETVKVQRGTMQVKVSGSGTVEPEESANLSFGVSGTIQKVLVKEGAAVKQGDVLATLDPRDLEQEALQSEANLQTAKAKLEQAKNGNAGEQDKRAAQAKIDQAVAQLEKTKKGSATPADIKNAEAGVRAAEAKLAAVKAEPAPARASAAQKIIKQSEIDQAQAQVDQAQAQLEKLKQGGSPEDITAAEAQVTEARAQFEKLSAPATSSDLAIAEASVRQAEAQVAAAKLNSDKATLRAPFDGIITAANVAAGDNVGATAGTTPPFTLVDARQRHINVSVSEADVAQVREGQPAQVTIDAIGTEPISGTVSYIAPAATVVQNVTTYSVRVNLPQNNAAIRVGMNAAVNIGVTEKKNVLLIPASAVRSEGAKRFVRVKNGDNFVDTEIRTGLSDDVQTEVVSGLKEGDTIAALGAAPAQG